MPSLHVVAGPNGVGKSTAFRNIIPDGLDYINADLIAKTIREQAGGLNAVDLAQMETSKVFYEKVANRESFALETNLCDLDTYKSFRALQASGYNIFISFLAVDDIQLLISRVKLRVQQGGHLVNPDVIRQRYITGLALLRHFRDFPDVLVLLDNSEGGWTTQAELRNGSLIFKADGCKPWAQSIIDTADTHISSPDISKEQLLAKYKAQLKGSKDNPLS